ncbi:MAG: TIGR04141 family sporadically distributed protein [Rhodospirillaceae bacterium]|nr:TIGR04141 family sporadically distributed protein [Rhodospirillaceae bacterium]
MNDKPLRTESLTIYLAKQQFTKPAELLREPGEYERFTVRDTEGALGALYVQKQVTKPPKWSRLFVPQIKPDQIGKVRSSAAVLVVESAGRQFLIAFGQGRHMIAPNCYEERFGLLVTLNSIGPESVRSIDKQALDTAGYQTRVQAPREAAPSEFGLDVERDLLRAITGTPTDKKLGYTLSGFDRLHAIVQVNIDTLRDLLSTYLVQFGKTTYRTNFDWIDKIGEVKQPADIEELDKLMIAELVSGKTDRCWLSIPEIIEWKNIAGFRYARGKKHATVHDFSFKGYLDDTQVQKAEITVEHLKDKCILAVDGDDEVQHEWPIYRCIHCEVVHKGDTYLLSGRKWYKIATDYVREVDVAFDKIPIEDRGLPSFGDENEAQYNERVAKSDAARFALMDADCIQIGGQNSKIEFCDLFTANKELIHVKRYGGSAVLSHLFSQGVVSGQLFASDPAFRTMVNAKLPNSHKLANPIERPSVEQYKVVYAIVKGPTASQGLSLPFFARLSAKNATKTLSGYDYKVVLSQIPIDATVAMTKKIQTGKAKNASMRKKSKK